MKNKFNLILLALLIILVLIALPFLIPHRYLDYWSGILGAFLSTAGALLIMFFTIQNDRKEREKEKREIIRPDNFIAESFHLFKNSPLDIQKETSSLKLPLHNLGNSAVYNLVFQYKIKNIDDFLPDSDSDKELISKSKEALRFLIGKDEIEERIFAELFPEGMSIIKVKSTEGDHNLFLSRISSYDTRARKWVYIDNFIETKSITSILKPSDSATLEIPDDVVKTVYYALRFTSQWKPEILCRLYYTNYKQEKYKIEFEFVVSTDINMEGDNYPLKILLDNLDKSLSDISAPLYLLVKNSTLRIQKVEEYERILY